MKEKIQHAIDTLNTIILGKPDVVHQAMVCLLAKGHLLIEDLPGTGKTTFSHALAKVLGMDYKRIQFTSDLLPADLIGVSVYQQQQGTFNFHPGPLFNQLILADEVNRATPKTQSALLEAMEEGQISVDGTTHALPQPFFVLATQNPSTQIGTFALPESQLDRFLMRLSMGNMDANAERTLLMGESRRDLLERTQTILEPKELLAIQALVGKVKVNDALVDYLQALLQHSRDSQAFIHGLSPRAGLGIKRAAQAQAMLDGRNFVTPEDIQAVILPIAVHRLLNPQHESYTLADLKTRLIEPVAIP